MDFHKDAKRNPGVFLQKVKDKMSLCKTTPDNLNAIRFVHIIADLKASKVGHIFKDKGFLKSENLEFL